VERVLVLTGLRSEEAALTEDISKGMSFDALHSSSDSRWIMVSPLVKCISIHLPENLRLYKLMYFGLS
jgi:hypothetical protein